MKHSIRIFSVVLLLAACVATGVVSSVLCVRFLPQNAAFDRGNGVPVAQASTSDRVDGYLTCTAPVDGGSEAVFVLDSTTGLLSAGVLSKVSPTFQSRYQGNVHADLRKAVTILNNRGKKGTSRTKKNAAKQAIQLPQEPKYIMTAGIHSIVGQGGNIRPGASALYITEVNTGLMLVYILPWNPSSFSSNSPFSSPLTYYTVDRFVMPMVMEEVVEEE
ncbi:MAG: hypothetical protein Q4D62_05965 [Planctomycetia bacterium]|nr:hypothetical protein [Planctomycetia bacterium]